MSHTGIGAYGSGKVGYILTLPIGIFLFLEISESPRLSVGSTRLVFRALAHTHLLCSAIARQYLCALCGVLHKSAMFYKLGLMHGLMGSVKINQDYTGSLQHPVAIAFCTLIKISRIFSLQYIPNCSTHCSLRVSFVWCLLVKDFTVSNTASDRAWQTNLRPREQGVRVSPHLIFRLLLF